MMLIKELKVVSSVLLSLLLLGTSSAAHVYSVDEVGTITKDGEPFVPVGVNAMSCFGKAKPEPYPGISKSIVREYVIMDKQQLECYASGCWARKLSTGNWLHPMEPVLDRNEQHGIVTILDLHKWNETLELWAKVPSETDFYDAYMDKLVNYYVPYLMDRSEVWLSIWNEPFQWDVESDPQLWSTEMEAILRAVRGAGYTNVIVVPAGQMGQDESVLLNGYAKDLADRYGPLVFDVHVYNRWLAQDQRTIGNRLAPLKAEGIAVLAGETGPSNAGQLHNPWPFVEEAKARDIGIVGWVWKCANNEWDKNAMRKNTPGSQWCQSWEFNDINNFEWGSGFAQYLMENTVI